MTSSSDLCDRLGRACYEGDLARVRDLVAMGADPDGRDARGWSMLRHACNAPDIRAESSTPVVRFLIEKGVELDSDVDLSGQRPINIALTRWQWTSVRCLLEAGALPPREEDLEWIRKWSGKNLPPGFIEELKSIAERYRLDAGLASAHDPSSHRLRL